MKKIIRLLLVSSIVLSLVACSFSASLFISNNTGQQITITSVISKAYQNGTPHIIRKKRLIPNGANSPLHGASDTGAGWLMEIEIGKCILQYSPPSSVNLSHDYWDQEVLHRSAREYSYIKLQIEPDFQVYLVPQASRGIVDVTTVLEIQQAGFPLLPVKNSCD